MPFRACHLHPTKSLLPLLLSTHKPLKTSLLSANAYVYASMRKKALTIVNVVWLDVVAPDEVAALL